MTNTETEYIILYEAFRKMDSNNSPVHNPNR